MRFPLKERAVLIPIELFSAIQPLLILAVAFLTISILGGPAGYRANAAGVGFLPSWL